MSPWFAMIVMNVLWFSLVSLPLWQHFWGVGLGRLYSKNQRFFYFRTFDFLGHIHNLRISDPRIKDPGMWNPQI